MNPEPAASPGQGDDYRRHVREQIQAISETLTYVMFGDFARVARTTRPDEDFGYLCAMINVAINAARNANDELRVANERLMKYQQELEQRVQERTAELSYAYREMEAFSYSAAHDLRAPLRSIEGYSHVLEADYSETLDPKAQRYLQQMRSNCRRMAQIIDGLLGLSRLMHTTIRRTRIDLSVMARTVAASLQQERTLGRAVVEIQDGLSAEGDLELIGLVLQNLLSNALKFTQKLPLGRIEFGATVSGGEAAYFVRDNGVGFDMAHAGKLFRPFQRLHAREEFEGSGIGLATVQRIIERHGGRVWAEAAVGRGATFFFTLGGAGAAVTDPAGLPWPPATQPPK